MNTDDKVVVIGSGPAGAAATLALTQVGVDVVLIEAGFARHAWGLTARVAGMTVARLHRSLQQRSEGVHFTGDPGTVLYEDIAPGGLTNHWSCAVPRFSPQDFLDAQRAGEAYAWPVGYDDLVRWYDFVEPLLRISGPSTSVPQLPCGKVSRVRELNGTWSAVRKAAESEGRGLTTTPYVYGGETTLTLSGTVFNSYVRLIKPSLRAGRVAVRSGIRALWLEWSGRQRRVQAVIVRDARTGAEHRLECRAVVLAAGAINSTKLLLQSANTDFPEGLGNTHGVLGRYLHDHPIAKVEIELASPLSFLPAAYLTRAPLATTPPLFAAACLQWTGVPMLVRSILKGRPKALPSCGFNIFGTMAPSLNNFVALDSSYRSSDGMPGLAVHIVHPQESTDTLVNTRTQLVDLLERAGLGPRLQRWVIDPVGSSVHFAGTCRMHASARYGMLDQWNRLHAVANVVVADSAAFTTGPEKNPVLTAMALAARAGDRLADDLRSGAV